MEPDDPLGDEEPHPRLLPPDDRLWRHPSEVAGHGPVRTRRGGRGTPPLWVVAALAGVVGALLSVGLMAATGNLRRILRVPVVERVAVPPGNASTAAGKAELAQRLGPAVVRLEVITGEAEPESGAGVVFRSDGHLLTNHHVVAGASRIVVVMADGHRSEGQLVGSDPWSDLAVVKVDDGGLAVPVAVLGSSSPVMVGQEVIAVGGEGGTARSPAVAVGVVGAVGQQIDREAGPPLLDMIRTDAPVAADSSGGALVDSTGAVVGILTALTPASGGPDGTGYATPIDWARRVADQLMAHGRVIRVWMGVEGDGIDASTAAGMGVPGGVRVEQIRDGSPARSAAVAVDDVITAVDGVPVSTMGALRVILRAHRPGDVVTLALVRRATAMSVRVQLAERPAQT